LEKTQYGTEGGGFAAPWVLRIANECWETLNVAGTGLEAAEPGVPQ